MPNRASVLALLGMLAATFTPTPTASAASRRAALFTVTHQAGHVTHIAVHVPATGIDYLIDRFVDDPEARARETELFQRENEQAVCRADEAGRRCRSTCAWAEQARPFMRIWQREHGGQFRLLWPVGQVRSDRRALKLYAGASSRSSRDGECISPDGRFISLYTYPSPYETERGKGAVVSKLTTNLPPVPFRGVASGKIYGEDRYFLFAGWNKAAAHRLCFSWSGPGDAGAPISIDDEGIPLPHHGR